MCRNAGLSIVIAVISLAKQGETIGYSIGAAIWKFNQRYGKCLAKCILKYSWINSIVATAKVWDDWESDAESTRSSEKGIFPV